MTDFELIILREIATEGAAQRGSDAEREDAVASLTEKGHLGGRGGVTARGMVALMPSEDSLVLMHLSTPKPVFDVDAASRLRRLGLVEQSADDQRKWFRTNKGGAVVTFMLAQTRKAAAS